MVRALEDAPPGTPIRQRAILAIRTRLDVLEPHKESMRRAAIFMALPQNGGDLVRMGWRASDLAWRAMGDTATDFNHYSKRMLLSAVHASTLAFWLQDDSVGHQETSAFLERRIANVMEIEKIKSRVNKALDVIPDPLGLLTRLRYGPQPRP